MRQIQIPAQIVYQNVMSKRDTKILELIRSFVD